jgi:hypothetical protein
MTTDPKPGSGEPSGIREGFVKRRRSLIAISVVLFLYHFGNASIDEAITLFGIAIQIPDQSAITYLLWATWAYFFVTFAQYHFDLKDRSFRISVAQKFEEAVTAFAGKEFKRKYESKIIERGVPEGRTIARISVESTLMRRVDPGEDLTSWMVTVRGCATYAVGTGYVDGNLEKLQIPIAGMRAWRFRAAAFVSTLVRSRYLGEYFLPYAIAAVLVAAVVIERCGGRPT